MTRVALGVMVAVSGCSFMSSTTVKGHTESCMPDRISPMIDTVPAAGALALEIAILSSSCGDPWCGLGNVIGLAFGLVVGVPYLLSAVHGFSLERCPATTRADAASN